MSIPLLINQGTQEEFNKINYYTTGSIYVCTDTGNVYLATEETKCTQLANTANFIGTTPASNVAQKDQIENVLAAHADSIDSITTNYLPLAGGTMTGNIETAKNIEIKAEGKISIAQGAQINLADGGKIKLAAQNENVENGINDDEPIRYDIYKTFKNSTSSSISTLESSLSSEIEAREEAIAAATADATAKANKAEENAIATAYDYRTSVVEWVTNNYATIEYVDNAINTLQNDLATELGGLL